RKESHGSDSSSWEGVDRDLFEELRTERKELAAERNVPPYQIFSDATLRELARIRPSNLEKLLLVYGIGRKKADDFGQRILSKLHDYCRRTGLAMDVAVDRSPNGSASPAPLNKNALA